MKSKCQEINLALKLCLDSGNDIKEISEGWSDAKKVFYMKESLAGDLKTKIETQASKLEYFKDAGSPQISPDEGFFCNECKEGVSFPMKK